MTEYLLLSRYPLIFCPLCRKQWPVRVAEMAADDRNDHDAVDLMCSNCDLVIATLHEDPEEKHGRAS